MTKWTHLLAAVAAIAMTGLPAAAARKPNVIVIVADDLGYGDTSAYGSTRVRTPNIDALAADGVRFTQGYASHPVCSPSRAALMAGRAQTRFGYEFNPVGRDRTTGVARSEVLLPQVMKDAGYATGMVGKWHLGQPQGYHPLDRGFSSFYGVLAGATSFMTRYAPGDESYIPPSTRTSFGSAEGLTFRPDATEAEIMTAVRAAAPVFDGRKPVEVDEYLTDAFTEHALSFIDRNKDRPFFLYLAHTAPHTPLQAPERYIARNRHIADKGQRVYAAMITALDDSVGAIRQRLKAAGIERDTLIVFLSDNGCAAYVEGACANTPLTGFKRDHLEGGVRVPYIVAWPGHIPGGRVDDQVVSTLDVAPTVAAMAGTRMPKVADGLDLSGYLTGHAPAPGERRLFWRTGPNFAIRDGDWKMWIANIAPAGEEVSAATIVPDGMVATVSPLGQHVMLYDLKADLAESRNLATERPEVVARLKAEIAAWDKGNIPAQWTSMRQSVRSHDGQRLRVYP